MKNEMAFKVADLDSCRKFRDSYPSKYVKGKKYEYERLGAQMYVDLINATLKYYKKTKIAAYFLFAQETCDLFKKDIDQVPVYKILPLNSVYELYDKFQQEFAAINKELSLASSPSVANGLFATNKTPENGEENPTPEVSNANR